MTNRRRNLFILLVVLAMLFGSAVVITNDKTVLGLDLKGGTELVYKGEPTPSNPTVDGSDIDRSIEIIRQRTDKLGVAEPEISRVGADQIRVGLPDVSNADRAQKEVGTTAQLYMYDWEPNVVAPPGESPQQAVSQPINRLYDAVKLASQQPKRENCGQCTTNGSTYYLFNKLSKQPIGEAASKRSDLFVNVPNLPPPDRREVLAVPRGYVVLQAADTGVDPSGNDSGNPPAYFVLKDNPSLTGNDITDPKQNFDPTTDQPIVTFNFTDKGRQEFSDVTKKIAERGLASAPPGVSDSNTAAQYSGSFAIVLDRDVVSRPIINFVDNPTGIDGRNGAEISGNFTISTAQDLATFLQIGALPINLKLISQSTVSATLGKQALHQGLKAGIVGLILVLLFLILYYRFLGLVAAVGLLVYGVFFFALVKLIPIVLTLPGIAGLILTIGVAADANIVIFERIKEEARAGKSIPSAIATGYRRGIATIIDANVITLITAFILFVLATAGVKGFAFTLGVGTITSLFTAVLFTQAFLGRVGRARFLRSPQVIGAARQRVRWHFDFSGASRWFFCLSGCILLIGSVSFATRQLNLGIDFKSGARITAGLQQNPTVDQVRSKLESAGIPNMSQAQIQTVSSTPITQAGLHGIQIDADLSPTQASRIQPVLNSTYGAPPKAYDSTTVGPTFGSQVARSAIYAIVFSLLVICGYVALRFEAKYAVPVMIALFHDILITGGVYSLVGREVTSGTIAAFLTILGYSMYDTVIVFDRIRENVPRLPRAAFSQIVNRSMSEVLTRSLITGLSSVFLVTVLYIFGGATLKDFAFAMMIGLASGFYSSIFIASPVLTHWKEREPAYRRRRERIEEQMGRVPPFPEENVISRLEPEAPPAARPAAPVPSRADVGAPRAPAPPTPAAPAEPAAPVPRAPVGAPETPVDGGDGASEGGDGVSQPERELSEASAAALRRVRQGRRQGRRRRKHGRPR